MARVTGTLIVVDRKTGPVYFFKARDRDGKQVKKRLGPVADWKPKAAQDALRDFLTDLGRVPERGESVTMRYAVDAWLRYVEHDRKRAVSTLRDYRNTMRRQIVDRIGERSLAEISLEDLDELRAELLAELSPRTVQKTLVLLHGVYRFARRKGWVESNPVAELESVTVQRRTEFAVLSPAEVQAVARHASGEWASTVILVAAFTGLRVGELRGLRWRDVDFSNRLIHVRRSHYGAAAAEEKAPKSGKARSVPLIDLVARALDSLSRRGEYTKPGDRVFCDVLGDTLSDGAIRSAFYEAMTAAKIDRDRGTGKDLVFHDLRHTFGTLAVREFPLSDVQAYMGHADIQTTMIYVHHQPQHAAADRLGRLVAGDSTEIPDVDSTPGAGTRGYPNQDTEHDIP